MKTGTSHHASQTIRSHLRIQQRSKNYVAVVLPEPGKTLILSDLSFPTFPPLSLLSPLSNFPSTNPPSPQPPPSLMSSLTELYEQLADVDALLADDPSNEEFVQLKADLSELIEITKAEEEEEEEEEGGGATGTEAAEAAVSDAPTDAPDSNIADDFDAMIEKAEFSPAVPVAEEPKKKKNITSGSVFVIPENLKVLPTDTEEVKLKKRKRVKGLKSKFNGVKSNAVATEKKANWQNFMQKGKGKSKVPKESMYATSDNLGVGVGCTSKGTFTSAGEKRKFAY